MKFVKLKLLLGLALVLSGGLFGCASAKFKVMPDQQQLMKNHRVVAEVTCLVAKPTPYMTFRDRYFRIGAMPPHVRWTVTFQVNKILKGKLAEQTVTLVDSRIAGILIFISTLRPEKLTRLALILDLKMRSMILPCLGMS
jgi:hypothetical protein